MKKEGGKIFLIFNNYNLENIGKLLNLQSERPGT